MFDLACRVAIVTGAGSVGPGWGNGRATAVVLARRGAAVFALDIDAAAVEDTRACIAGEGGTCMTEFCDRSDAPAVEAAIAACLAHFGRLEVIDIYAGGNAALC